jgi:hypothetical protein
MPASKRQDCVRRIRKPQANPKAKKAAKTRQKRRQEFQMDHEPIGSPPERRAARRARKGQKINPEKIRRMGREKWKTPALTESAAALLIRLLGQQDALFVPFRDAGASWWAAAWSARREYARTGLRWRGRARKQDERDLVRLAKKRLLVKVKKGSAKTLSIRLSDEGDRIARALAGIETFDAGVCSFEELRHLASVREENGTTLHGGWIPETDLSDGVGWGDGNQQELTVVQAVAMPALVRGWVESNCDSKRHVYYRNAVAGEIVAEAMSHKVVLPSEVDGGAAIYDESLGESREALKMADAPAGEIGAIPLPDSMGLLPAGGASISIGSEK